MFEFERNDPDPVRRLLISSRAGPRRFCYEGGMPLEVWTTGAGVPGLASRHASAAEAAGYDGLALVDSQNLSVPPSGRCSVRRTCVVHYSVSPLNARSRLLRAPQFGVQMIRALDPLLGPRRMLSTCVFFLLHAM